MYAIPPIPARITPMNGGLEATLNLLNADEMNIAAITVDIF